MAVKGWLILLTLGLLWTMLGIGNVHKARRVYETTDGRCWSAFVPSNKNVEQPATVTQQAVKPLYAVEVPCG